MTTGSVQPYSDGMISEFQELSNKVDLLVAMTLTLRRENAALRQAGAALSAENAVYVERMHEAQQRIELLLEKIPELVQAGLAQAAEEQGKDAR